MEGEVRIYGKISDSEGLAITNAEVVIKDSGFKDIAKGKTNDLGIYELFIQIGQYVALSAVAEHGVKYLPYWEWNFCPIADAEINITLDRLEVYAINAIIPQGTYPQFMIYFRPMSLTKTLLYKNGPKVNKGELVPITPTLDIEDIEVTIDEQVAKIFTISKVDEFAGDVNVRGYMITTQRPKQMKYDEYTKIRIKIRDKETEEIGEGVLYY